MILRWHVLVTQFRHCGCQSRPHHCPSQLEEPDHSWREQPQLSPWLPEGNHSWVHGFLSGQTLEPSSPDKRRQQLPVPGQGFAALNIFFLALKQLHMEKSPEQHLAQGDSLSILLLQSQKFDLLQPLAQLSLDLSGHDLWDQGNTGGTSSTQKKAEVPGKTWRMLVHSGWEVTVRPTVPEARMQSVHHIPIIHGQVVFFYICKARELGQSQLLRRGSFNNEDLTWQFWIPLCFLFHIYVRLSSLLNAAMSFFW